MKKIPDKHSDGCSEACKYLFLDICTMLIVNFWLETLPRPLSNRGGKESRARLEGRRFASDCIHCQFQWRINLSDDSCIRCRFQRDFYAGNLSPPTPGADHKCGHELD